jgi:hypothetical protein
MPRIDSSAVRSALSLVPFGRRSSTFRIRPLSALLHQLREPIVLTLAFNSHIVTRQTVLPAAAEGSQPVN